MYQTRPSVSTPSTNHRSGNGPVPSVSPNRPLLPFYSSIETRHYQSRHRPLESGLSQMLMSHRASLLTTASLALVGSIRRPSVPDIEENRVKDIRPKSSGSSFWPRAKQCTQYVYEKSHLKNLLPLLILLGYSFLGGAVVYWIEAPYERFELEGKQNFLDEQKEVLAQKVWDIREQRFGKTRALMNLREAVHWYTIITMYMDVNLTRLPPSSTEIVTRVGVLKKYTEEMAQRCWEIRLERNLNRTEIKRKISDSLKLFELFTGVSTDVRPIWTFSNALFLAITIYTTIGYGSVAPHTVAGRVATIIYAIIGIPVYLMILHKLGRVFLKLLHKLWNLTLKFAHYIHCIKQTDIGPKFHDKTKLNAPIKKVGGLKENDNNIPVSLAVGVTFLWMLTCAGVCCLFFETSWDYFTSFYFFFISLTTIGFGDVTPTHPEYMFTMFGLIIVGLSLVSMCINVVQLKLELLFEEMMLALMEEYEKTGQVLDGDMMESALLQRGLGMFQMMKLWTRKKRASEHSPTETTGEVSRPMLVRKRRDFLQELQRRRRSRTVGTQTEFWQMVNYENVENTPWVTSSERRRRLKTLLILHEATQTDASDDSTFLVTIPPSSHLDPWPNCIMSAPDHTESPPSLSSSLITCHDNNSSPFPNCPVIINEPEEDQLTTSTRPTSPMDTGHLAESSKGSDDDETGTPGSKTSADLINFIPYIEQEVPPDQEMPRRWSAAEAMSVFATWSAHRDFRRQSRQSRRSSHGDHLDDELVRFRNMKGAGNRRVTVAVAAPQPRSASKLRLKRLDEVLSRAEGALSAMRLHSREPSSNDIKALEHDFEKPKLFGQMLTAVDPSARKRSTERAFHV